jgi:hypothetical protein
MDPTGTDGGGMGGGIGVVTGGGMMNREQIKKMSEADKEMELRANRAKALLAERHIGLKENQVCIIFEMNRHAMHWLGGAHLSLIFLVRESHRKLISLSHAIIGSTSPAKDAA